MSFGKASNPLSTRLSKNVISGDPGAARESLQKLFEMFKRRNYECLKSDNFEKLSALAQILSFVAGVASCEKICSNMAWNYGTTTIWSAGGCEVC